MPEYSCRVTLRTANWEVSFENVARIDFTWFSYCQNTSSFYKTTHVLHAEHHGGVPMSWARACYVLKRRLQFMNHMNLFAILKPLKNLNALFRKSARTTLQGSRDHA